MKKSTLLILAISFAGIIFSGEIYTPVVKNPFAKVVVSKNPVTEKYTLKDLVDAVHVQKFPKDLSYVQLQELCELHDFFICALAYSLESGKTIRPDETLCMHVVDGGYHVKFCVSRDVTIADIQKATMYLAKEHEAKESKSFWLLQDIRKIFPRADALIACGIFVKDMPPAYAEKEIEKK